MPIQCIDHGPDQRARRRAELIAQADRESLRTIVLPVGRRQIEVMREQRVVLTVQDDGSVVVGAVVEYELTGDLELFGCDMFATIPIHAVDDADAVTQATRLVQERWLREGALIGDGAGGDQPGGFRGEGR